MDRAYSLAKNWRAVIKGRSSVTTTTPSPAPGRFTAIITPDELDGGWIAECLDFPGCMTQGETREEAVNNLIDAILEVMAVRMAEHKPEPVRDDPQKVALCYG